MELRVRRAGMHTTVQDLGRSGFRSDGVPVSGAMDRVALRLANLLVGNDENAPALEFTLLGPEIEFSHDALVVITGVDVSGTPSWRPVRVSAGTLLKLSAVHAGCRGYLAIAGGFEVPRVLGSASAYPRGGFGGGFGRPLREGDVLVAPDLVRHVAHGWRIDARILPAYSASPEIRVVTGAQVAEFGRQLFEATFTVTTHSDRMGFRLKGPALVRTTAEELRSMAVAPGTVQVPPDGHPIILMADAQTMGGYPQIAHVIGVDLPVVAQLRPGDAVTFRDVPLAEAHELMLAREHALAMLRHGLAQKFS